MRSLIKSVTLVLIMLFLAAPFIAAQVNQVTLADLKINPTFEHIAIHMDIVGDDNLDSSLEIEYRLRGTTNYYPAAMTLRATPDMIVSETSLLMNFHAGSAMHLLPYSVYELRLTLHDPDGGGQVIETEAVTRKFPTTENSTDIIYVVPGNGGGDGSLANPYQGLQLAATSAQAGQIIEVADGIYSPFFLNESGTENQPIVMRSTNLHGAVIDGGNISTGVVTIGVFNDSIQHIILDGFEIRNGRWAIDAQNTQYFTVRNNKLNDVDWGIYNRRQNGWEHDQFITNNEFVGRTFWPQTGGEIPSERAIDVRGNRNVISYNTISDFGDGITTDGPPYKVSYALDIHHNDITRIVDDLIEIDGSVSNARVYKNRGYNGRMGVSVAPVFGGPAYIFRNEFYNLEYSSIKMNREPAGLIIINNSMVKINRGLTSNAGWQNTIFKNNAVLSSQYVMEEYGLVAGSTDDWDHNGYHSERSGTSDGPWFKWDNIRYNNIAALTSSGITEANTIGIDYSDFVDLSLPAAYAIEALPNDHDFMPTSNSTLIDAGLAFDNILDFDEIINSPDIGVYELGQPTPNYGRDFNNICERIDLATRTWNGSKNIGWYHPQNWTPCGVPSIETTVTVPGGLSKYPFVNTNINISDLYLTNDGKVNLMENVELKLND